jgi:FkbM family methyltransferase
VRNLARWSLRQLEQTRLFRARPLLAPLLRTAWRYARARTPEAGEAALQALGVGGALRYPILFRDRHGLEYLLYPGENAEIYLANHGNYEVAETEFCLKQIAPGMTAFDVGANIGLYTLLFAKCAGPAGRVHAFEPEPRNFRRLQINLALNGCENVTANPLAVAANSGPVTLHVYPAAFHAWHSLTRAAMPDPDRPGETISPEREAQVQAASLDDYCAARSIARIDYLKIDVEGAEVGVLAGARGLLEREAVGLIQFEALPGAGAGPSEVFALLREHGFHIRAIGPEGELLPEAPEPLPAYTNYAAVR